MYVASSQRSQMSGLTARERAPRQQCAWLPIVNIIATQQLTRASRVCGMYVCALKLISEHLTWGW